MPTITRCEIYETFENSGVLEIAMMTSQGIKQFTIGAWDAWMLQGLLETELGPYITSAVVESDFAHLAPAAMEPFGTSVAA